MPSTYEDLLNLDPILRALGEAVWATAKAEGVFTVKTLTKEEVKHMIEEDGAKFDKINADGTVTEVSFEATGVELTMKK